MISTWTTFTTKKRDRGRETTISMREVIVIRRAQIPGPSSQAKWSWLVFLDVPILGEQGSKSSVSGLLEPWIIQHARRKTYRAKVFTSLSSVIRERSGVINSKVLLFEHRENLLKISEISQIMLLPSSGVIYQFLLRFQIFNLQNIFKESEAVKPLPPNYPIVVKSSSRFFFSWHQNFRC